jgi:hypothetical protein
VGAALGAPLFFTTFPFFGLFALKRKRVGGGDFRRSACRRSSCRSNFHAAEGQKASQQNKNKLPHKKSIGYSLSSQRFEP